MTTIQLTDVQLAQFTATGLIIVDEDVFVSTAMKDMIGPNTPGTYTLAPELWRKLTDPCRRCGPPNVGQGCPDCAGGRQVVTLTATCPTCKGDGTTCVQTAVDSYEIGTCEECPAQEGDDDTGTGVVTLGRFTIRLLPVVAEHTPTDRVIVADGKTTAFRMTSSNESVFEELALDPLPQPGQWVVIPEAVS